MTFQQRTTEWDFKKFTEASKNYHLNQWKEQKRSTIFFAEYVRSLIADSKKVIDLACGAGAATYFLAKNHEHCSFVGIDISEELVSIANSLSKEENIPNISFNVDDWYELGDYGNIDGVISLQTFSFLPDCELALKEIFEKINPNWISLSSQFYEGEISATIETHEHLIDRKSLYSVYSLPYIERICRKYGYTIDKYKPFEIDIDIEKPSSPDYMATHTKQLSDVDGGGRLQFSGPLLMNWYFLIIKKI